MPNAEEDIKLYMENCFEPAHESYRVIKEQIKMAIGLPLNISIAGSDHTEDDDDHLNKSGEAKDTQVTREEFSL